MTDDLKPRSHHWQSLIATAVAAGGVVWGATSWLHNRADVNDVKALTNNSFQQRLDFEVFKGKVETVNIRLENLEKAINLGKGIEEINRKLERRRAPRIGSDDRP